MNPTGRPPGEGGRGGASDVEPVATGSCGVSGIVGEGSSGVEPGATVANVANGLLDALRAVIAGDLGAAEAMTVRALAVLRGQARLCPGEATGATKKTK